MELTRNAALIGGLAVNSWLDIRSRKVSMLVVYLMLGSGLVIHLVEKDLFSVNLVLALIPGLACLLLSAWTREAIGFGDSWMILGMGGLLYPEQLMTVGITALFGAAVTGLLLMSLFRKSGRYELPFVPFLFGAYILVKGIDMWKL